MSYMSAPGVIFRDRCRYEDVLDDLRGRRLCLCHIELNTLRDNQGPALTAVIFAVNDAGAAWLFQMDCPTMNYVLELRQALMSNVRPGSSITMHSGELSIDRILRSIDRRESPFARIERPPAAPELTRAIEL